MQNINKMKQLLNPSDKLVSSLMTMSSADVANEALIGILMQRIKSDEEALEFCDIMESLVDKWQSKRTIESLRNGNYIDNECTVKLSVNLIICHYVC